MSLARSNAGHKARGRRWMPGRRWGRRKASYLKGPFAKPYTGKHKTTRKVSARRARRAPIEDDS